MRKLSCEELLPQQLNNTGGASCKRMRRAHDPSNYSLECSLKPCHQGYRYTFTPQDTYTCHSKNPIFLPTPVPVCVSSGILSDAKEGSTCETILPKLLTNTGGARCRRRKKAADPTDYTLQCSLKLAREDTSTHSHHSMPTPV